MTFLQRQRYKDKAKQNKKQQISGYSCHEGGVDNKGTR